MTTTQEIVPFSLAETMELGTVLARSGFFADSRDAAQAVVKVLAGKEMGFGPIAAMSGIHVIKGKVSIGANLMAAAVKRSGRYNYLVTTLDTNACVIDFFDGKTKIGTSSFTVEDAKAAGLLGNDNWTKHRRNMLFARAMSNGVKWFCPDVFGGAPVYDPEELGAVVDGETGEVVQAPQVTIENPGNGNSRRIAQRLAQPADDSIAYEHADAEFAALPSASAERQPAAPQPVPQPTKQSAPPRPWTAEMTIYALQQSAVVHERNGEGDKNGSFGALTGYLSQTYGDERRKAFLKAVFGVDSAANLKPAQRLALVGWSGIVKTGPDKSDPWAISADATTEFERIVPAPVVPAEPEPADVVEVPMFS